MKCIFCLLEKPPSDEHVIPDSIGGKIHINEVCKECNSTLSSLVDNPFASCSLIQLARYTHSLGGKRDIVPFPFGGVGTFNNGQKVSLDRSFTPHVKRDLNFTKLQDGTLQVHFIADASDRDKLEQMLGEPLRKKMAVEFPEWTQAKLNDEIAKILARANEQSTTPEHGPIKKQLIIGLNDLLFEFLKIAYEMWFRKFGYSWVAHSTNAQALRTALMNRDANQPIRRELFCPEVPLPVSDPFKNHVILQMSGCCYIRLFNITCMVVCEETDMRFMLTQEDSSITIQDFLSGSLTEDKLLRFLAQTLVKNQQTCPTTTQ